MILQLFKVCTLWPTGFSNETTVRFDVVHKHGVKK